MNNAQNNNVMNNTTTTAEEILKARIQRRLDDHRQHLAELEQKENKTRQDQINISVTKRAIARCAAAIA